MEETNSLEEAARYAMHLSKIMNDTPVNLCLYGVSATVGQFDNPLHIARELRKGIEEKAKHGLSLVVDIPITCPVRDRGANPGIQGNVLSLRRVPTTSG
jgi:hypothetical protein